MAQARAAFWPSSMDTRAAELALGDELAFGVEAELARNHHEVAGAHERHIIGDGRGRLRQYDAEVRKLLFDGSGH